MSYYAKLATRAVRVVAVMGLGASADGVTRSGSMRSGSTRVRAARRAARR